MTSVLRLGTRGSDLARAQAEIVAAKLRAAHPKVRVEMTIITTAGDQRLDIRFADIGPLDRGLFTKELEEALLSGKIDAAVHSLKDLPIEQPHGLTIGAILERADPRDALVSRSPEGLAGLRTGARVGTSSPRRKVELLRLRADIEVVEIRGNVPTRLRKLAENSSLDGLLLAKAGLDRLGPNFLPDGLHIVAIPEILPAPGQGAVAVECRIFDKPVLGLLSRIHHEDTSRCVRAEREFLRSHGGGCHLPVAALAVMENNALVMRTSDSRQA